jgi:hypothetical protein
LGEDENPPSLAVLTTTETVDQELLARAGKLADLVIKFVADGPVHQSPGSKNVGIEQVYASIESDFGYLRPEFSKEEIGGVVISFNPSIIADLTARLDEDAPYYKGGPVGKFAQNGHTALLFSEGGRQIPLGGVVGYGKIKQIREGEPSVVHNDLAPTAKPLITDEKYSMLFSTKGSVIGFILGDLRMIKPLERSDIESFLGELSDVEMSEIGHRYLSKSQLEKFHEIAVELESPVSSTQPADVPMVGGNPSEAQEAAGGRVRGFDAED